MRPANPERGDVVIVLAGRARIACLTLGALATLEGVFAVSGLAAVVRAIRTAKPDTLRAAMAAICPVPEAASTDEMRRALNALFLAAGKP